MKRAFAPLSRPSTAELLTERLREAMTRGQLVQGQQLGEASPATQLAVSRGPLRETAHRAIATAGLTSGGARTLELEVVKRYQMCDLTRADVDLSATL